MALGGLDYLLGYTFHGAGAIQYAHPLESVVHQDTKEPETHSSRRSRWDVVKVFSIGTNCNRIYNGFLSKNYT